MPPFDELHQSDLRASAVQMPNSLALIPSLTETDPAISVVH